MAVKAILTARDEEILKAVHYYRYVTARDIAHQQFSKTSLNYVRERLTELSGPTDLEPRNYLCRFDLPAASMKRQEKVFVLGAKGKRVLQWMGIPATQYFRPHKLKFLSYSYVIHNLILARTMIAAEQWAKDHPTYSLTDKRISYELSGKVIPDGWLRFSEQASDGTYAQPVIIELDRGMEYRDRFRAHVRGRINYIQSGEYTKTFNTKVVTIAYLTTGQTAEYRVTRQKAMCTWIKELLKDMRLEAWAGVFKVASVEFQTLYDHALFESAVWFRPDSDTPVRLFD
jgi:hypothetical protein